MGVIRRIARKPDLFRHRIIIVIPPWGVVIVAGAIGIAIFDRLPVVTEAIAILAALLALGCAWTARRMVRDLRYQVHEVLNDIGNETIEPAAEAEPAEAEVFQLRDKGA